MTFAFTKKEELNNFTCRKGILLSKYVCVPKGYLKGEAPKPNTVVHSRIEINNIRDIDDKKMRISLEYYHDMRWIDNRIKTKFPSLTNVSVLNNNLISIIWKPDLWIKNLYEHDIHSVLEPTGGLTIGKNCGRPKEKFQPIPTCIEEEVKHGTSINYNLEALATIYCNFNFENYPMDTQLCDFSMDGAYPLQGVVEFKLKLGQFGKTNQNTNTDEFEIDVSFHNDTYPVRGLIKMKRCLLPYIIKYYLPCIAIIIVSLISFLISIDSLPARVALLVTQFLTLTNILIAQQVCV
jgi:hypothetical protein